MAGVPLRQFESGATRDTDVGKFDYEGFLSPLVIERYGEYMHSHRTQSDGNLRDSDNWQKGIPFKVYMKSAWRHFFDWWKCHRQFQKEPTGYNVSFLEESLCALLFNAMGYLHELLKCQGRE
jgi:hypothetical protein